MYSYLFTNIPVPDTEPASVILIQTISVCTMMHPVVRGCVEDTAKKFPGHQLTQCGLGIDK